MNVYNTIHTFLSCAVIHQISSTFWKYFYNLTVWINPLFALISCRWLHDVGMCQDVLLMLFTQQTPFYTVSNVQSRVNVQPRIQTQLLAQDARICCIDITSGVIYKWCAWNSTIKRCWLHLQLLGAWWVSTLWVHSIVPHLEFS